MGTDAFAPQRAESFSSLSAAIIAAGRLPPTPADESSSQGGTSHSKIANSAILGWGTPGDPGIVKILNIATNTQLYCFDLLTMKSLGLTFRAMLDLVVH
jgi:hypothetical protein